MREKGQTEVAKTLETPVFSRGIEILTEKKEFATILIVKSLFTINVHRVLMGVLLYSPVERRGLCSGGGTPGAECYRPVRGKREPLQVWLFGGADCPAGSP